MPFNGIFYGVKGGNVRLKNLVGQRFGRWIVIERAANIGRHVCWLSRCDCGTERPVSSTNLVKGISKSCGCYHISVVSTHGLHDSPEYGHYLAMKQRCNNPRTSGYKHYGGRGIQVCQRWLDSFSNFYIDMGTRPSPEHTVDRLDPNGNYSPDNCRWATLSEQANNTRSSRFVEFQNKTQTVSQWAKHLGVSKSLISYRLNSGWSIEKTLTTPSSRPKPQ